MKEGEGCACKPNWIRAGVLSVQGLSSSSALKYLWWEEGKGVILASKVCPVSATGATVSLTCVVADSKAVRSQLVNDFVDSHSFKSNRHRS